MNTLAFMLDGHGWYNPAADLITPGFLWIPAILAPLCCYIVARNRRNASYAIGLAAAPAVLVFGRLFLKTLQYDLRDYPTQQITIALFVALFPGLATGVVYLLRRCWPLQPQLPEVTRQSSTPALRADCSPRVTTSSIRYGTGDDDNGDSAGAKTLLIALTVSSWLLIFCALLMVSIPAVVATTMPGHQSLETEGALWCILGALFFAPTASMAWFFGVRRTFKRAHSWARRCALATYLAVPATVACPAIAVWMEDHILAARFVIVGALFAVAAILSSAAIKAYRRLARPACR